MDKKINISAVSYLNTYPFVYGLLHSGSLKDFTLNLEVPSKCASDLAAGKADIALVPVGAIPDFPSAEIISGYCIGAVSKVKTVLLLSRVPLQEIHEIHLDRDSRTSVQLVKVLSKEYWKINPGWVPIDPKQIIEGNEPESVVAIGDKTFDLSGRYPYVYDLAEEWIRFTSLPFVFAVWLAGKKTPVAVLDAFNNALRFGVEHIPESLAFFQDKLPKDQDCRSYLEKNISFALDTQKLKGMNKFLSLMG